MSYLKKNRLWAGMLLTAAVSYNLYYIFLIKIPDIQELLYLDVLLAAVVFLAAGIDAAGYYKKKREKEQMLHCAHVVCRELDDAENLDVAYHDVDILEKQLREQFDQNCSLQDYIAKWCHEVKMPLSASLLMNEKIEDLPLKRAQKQQLEKIRQQLNGALLGCRVQSSLFDLQVRAEDLLECVKTAVHNNQYFLIQSQFELSLQVQPLLIYTDKSWLVYVLDQLIQNSIKYASQKPVLKICSEQKEKEVILRIWDNGQGILESDIRRIFERGYTGSGYHNGKYKSTGMGLYMVSQILERLGNAIEAESEHGVYTQFAITLRKMNVSAETAACRDRE